MAKKLRYTVNIMGRFLDGTAERVDAVLVPPETRADLVRVAVERELVDREEKQPCHAVLPAR